MVHIDIKKVGKIPDGGGWRAHCHGSEQARRSQRRKTKNKQARIDYTYLHSAIDGNTRLAYTEARDNETAATAIDFMNNARVFFAAHGSTSIERVITDDGSCYRAADERMLVPGVPSVLTLTQIGDRVSFPGSDHRRRREGWERAAPIVIGENMWLGDSVTVGAGVSIGRNAVIGAGSVVLHDVSNHVVAAGSPARVIRSTPVEADARM